MKKIQDVPFALRHIRRAKTLCDLHAAMVGLVVIAVMRMQIDEEGSSPIFASLLYDRAPAEI